VILSRYLQEGDLQRIRRIMASAKVARQPRGCKVDGHRTYVLATPRGFGLSNAKTLFLDSRIESQSLRSGPFASDRRFEFRRFGRLDRLNFRRVQCSGSSGIQSTGF
jgi:hypothetical protein